MFRLPWETTLFGSRTWDNYAAPPLLQYQRKLGFLLGERPLRPALADRDQSQHSARAEPRADHPGAARHRLVEPFPLRLHQQLGAGRSADPVLGSADVLVFLGSALRGRDRRLIGERLVDPAAAQQRVGSAGAVNEEATSAPPGAVARRLVVGQEVVFNERVTTGPAGQTQLLFLDESAMTVGPNSDVTIDQFVYDPNRGNGQMAMSAGRGVLRFVGGKLSKQENAVTLRTTSATIAIRGGVS